MISPPIDLSKSTMNTTELSPLKRALLAIEELQAKLDTVEKAATRTHSDHWGRLSNSGRCQ